MAKNNTQVQIDELIALVTSYLPDEDGTLLRRAHAFAAEVHSEKRWPSGEPYVIHPLAVAHILAGMKLDVQTIAAGLLHGVLKEKSASEAQLEELFGQDITTIVRGATRITDVKFSNQLQYQAENVRKMILAVSADIRVLLVKLADRLHDMRSLHYRTAIKQQEIAQETIDLYAPLASRLGIDWMKRELEDLCFEYLHPEEYRDLETKMSNSTLDRTAYVDGVRELLHQKLTEYGLAECRILGRPKHLYSIFRKLLAQKIPLEEVYDKVAFRIIFKTEKECYEALGLVHSLWRPVPGRFKDFISLPKGNLYQSLHTTVVGPRGEFMEIQIRTEEMDTIAQEGIAAHWAYKEKKSVSSKDANLFRWLKQLVQWQQELKDPKEFLDALKLELYEPDICVLTPNGEVKEFPRGSTPIDFAYGIHTDVGNHCVGAKVQGRIVPLRYQLQNGDQVEILTTPNQHPNRDWLNLVKTSRARARIRQWLKQEEQQKLLAAGREICERELRKHNLSLKKIVSTGHLKEILKSSGANNLEDFIRGVGAGKITIANVLNRLLPEEIRKEEPVASGAAFKKLPTKTEARDAVTIQGVDDLLVRVSRCCMPVPGDEVMGFVTIGQGVAIHKANCVNLLTSDPQRRIDVDWSATPATTMHRAQITVRTQNKKGILASLTSALNADDANILDLEAHTQENDSAILRMVLEVEDLDHLRRILAHIRQLDGILEARRW